MTLYVIVFGVIAAVAVAALIDAVSHAPIEVAPLPRQRPGAYVRPELSATCLGRQIDFVALEESLKENGDHAKP